MSCATSLFQPCLGASHWTVVPLQPANVRCTAGLAELPLHMHSGIFCGQVTQVPNRQGGQQRTWGQACAHGNSNADSQSKISSADVSRKRLQIARLGGVIYTDDAIRRGAGTRSQVPPGPSMFASRRGAHQCGAYSAKVKPRLQNPDAKTRLYG